MGLLKNCIMLSKTYGAILFSSSRVSLLFIAFASKFLPFQEKKKKPNLNELFLFLFFWFKLTKCEHVPRPAEGKKRKCQNVTPLFQFIILRFTLKMLKIK